MWVQGLSRPSFPLPLPLPFLPPRISGLISDWRSSSAALQQYIQSILVLLAKRLQSSKTPTFNYSFVYFSCFVLAIKKDDITPDWFIAQWETVQPGIFAGIMQGILLPQAPKTAVKDRKVVSVGLTRLLTQSETMLTEPLVKAWWVGRRYPTLRPHVSRWSISPTLPHVRPSALNALLAIVLLPQDLTSHTAAATDDISGLDLDDGSGGGFQSSFAKLGASEAVVEDPVAWVGTSNDAVAAYLKGELQRIGARVGPLLGQCDPQALARLQSS
jgi:exportin-2 (importin alpha re-exporter)